jgi:chromosome partitioning protein
MSPLQSRVAAHARAEIQTASIPVLQTEVIQRAAYQALHFTGLSPSAPDGDAKAAREVGATLEELLAVLAEQQQAA